MQALRLCLGLPLASKYAIGDEVKADDTGNNITSSKDAFELMATLQDQGEDIKIVAELQVRLKALVSAAIHWQSDHRNQLLFWLGHWIAGRTPPPRCAAIIDEGGPVQCFSVAEGGRPFCAPVHACHAHEHGGLPCQRLRRVDLPYCEEHRCLKRTTDVNESVCTLPRWATSSFCVDHCCALCLAHHDGDQNGVACKQGSFACLDHQCRGHGCNRAQVAPHSFCELHCCGKCVEEGNGPSNPLPDPRGALCTEHACAFPDCLALRARGFGSLCVLHTCEVCADGGQSAAAADAMVDSLCPESRLCRDHRCSHPGTAHLIRLHCGRQFQRIALYLTLSVLSCRLRLLSG